MDSFNCKCLNCGHDFHVTEGGGMTSTVYWCDSCGNTHLQPRYAPRLMRNGLRLPSTLKREFKHWQNIFGDRATIADDGSFCVAELSSEQVERFAEGFLIDYLSEPERWGRSGDCWDEHERALMLQLRGACSCGGQWLLPSRSTSNSQPHDLHKCPQCRSSRLHAVPLFDKVSD